MSEEAIYHFGPFEVVCRNCIDDIDILEELLRFELDDYDWEE